MRHHQVEVQHGSADYVAMGNHGQLIYVSPSADIVVVRTGRAYGLPAFEWMGAFHELADRLAETEPALSGPDAFQVSDIGPPSVPDGFAGGSPPRPRSVMPRGIGIHNPFRIHDATPDARGVSAHPGPTHPAGPASSWRIWRGSLVASGTILRLLGWEPDVDGTRTAVTGIRVAEAGVDRDRALDAVLVSLTRPRGQLLTRELVDDYESVGVSRLIHHPPRTRDPDGIVDYIADPPWQW